MNIETEPMSASCPGCGASILDDDLLVFDPGALDPVERLGGAFDADAYGIIESVGG